MAEMQETEVYTLGWRWDQLNPVWNSDHIQKEQTARTRIPAGNLNLIRNDNDFQSPPAPTVQIS